MGIEVRILHDAGDGIGYSFLADFDYFTQNIRFAKKFPGDFFRNDDLMRSLQHISAIAGDEIKSKYMKKSGIRVVNKRLIECNAVHFDGYVAIFLDAGCRFKPGKFLRKNIQ